MNSIRSMAIVATGPSARRDATMPAAMSIWLSTQPPKICPLALMSLGPGTTRRIALWCGSVIGNFLAWACFPLAGVRGTINPGDSYADDGGGHDDRGDPGEQGQRSCDHKAGRDGRRRGRLAWQVADRGFAGDRRRRDRRDHVRARCHLLPARSWRRSARLAGREGDERPRDHGRSGNRGAERAGDDDPAKDSPSARGRRRADSGNRVDRRPGQASDRADRERSRSYAGLYPIGLTLWRIGENAQLLGANRCRISTISI